MILGTTGSTQSSVDFRCFSDIDRHLLMNRVAMFFLMIFYHSHVRVLTVRS